MGGHVSRERRRLDAFVAALVGRAKHLGLADALPPEQAATGVAKSSASRGLTVPQISGKPSAGRDHARASNTAARCDPGRKA